MKNYTITSSIAFIYITTSAMQNVDDIQIPLEEKKSTVIITQPSGLPTESNESCKPAGLFCCTTVLCTSLGCAVSTIIGCSRTTPLPQSHTPQQYWAYVDQNIANTTRVAPYITPWFALVPTVAVGGYYGYTIYQHYKNKINFVKNPI